MEKQERTNTAKREQREVAPRPRAGDKQVPPANPSEQLAGEFLVVYRNRAGEPCELWTAEHGNVPVPDSWQFLPRGNTYVTRQVKKGPHWVLKGSYSRKGGYTPTLGIYAPAEAIEAAQAAAKATEQQRQSARKKAESTRLKAERRYSEKFEQACLQFLNFAPAHRELAERIAAETAAHACAKGSGRVGRTGLIELADKAAFAVRAHIRHNYTDYENKLPEWRGCCAEDIYRDVKAGAHAAVNEFLQEHRTRDFE
jgi:hypothetical protein